LSILEAITFIANESDDAQIFSEQDVGVHDEGDVDGHLPGIQGAKPEPSSPPLDKTLACWHPWHSTALAN
jgi:hypothetical protein